jgi:hypothetical protein
MRLQELNNTPEEGTMPKVYLDMDGVLADFFSEYAKLAGVTSGKYRDIPPAKADPTLDKIVGTDFFARLPKFDTTDDLVKIITEVFGGYGICSSPLRGDHENSEKQKNIWISENLSTAPDEVIITSKKEKYAVQPDGTPNILIDDRGVNISKWEAAGGIGIKYQADEDSLEVVVEGLKKAAETLKGPGSDEEDQDLSEKKLPPPTKSQCAAGRGHLSNVRYGQCVSRGMLSHNSGHTAGTGKQGKKGSGVKLQGKKLASTAYGGPVKDYGGKHGVKRRD